MICSLTSGQVIITNSPYNTIVEEGVANFNVISFVGSGAGCTYTVETTKTTGIISLSASDNFNSANFAITWGHANSGTITYHISGCSATPSANGDYSKTYPILNIPDNISGSTNVSCGVQSITYSVPSVANANSYEWTYPSGWTVSGSSTSNSITLQSNLNGSGNVNVKAVNESAKTSSNTISVSRPTVNSNSFPLITDFGSAQGTLTGSKLLCSSTNFTNSTLDNAQEYRWVATGGVLVGVLLLPQYQEQHLLQFLHRQMVQFLCKPIQMLVKMAQMQFLIQFYMEHPVPHRQLAMVRLLMVRQLFVKIRVS